MPEASAVAVPVWRRLRVLLPAFYRDFRVLIFGRRLSHGRIDVRGNEAFIQATVRALELLQSQTPEVYGLLERHIGGILPGGHSYVYTQSLARFSSTIVHIGPKYIEGPAVEYAGILAHETFHCELYRRAEESACGGDVPRNAYAGPEAESLCLNYQCDVLRRLGLDEARVQLYQKTIESKWWAVPFDQKRW